MYLLDITAVSELRRPRPHGAMLEWIADLPAEQLFASADTVGEIHAGIKITREHDDAKPKQLEAWLDKDLASYAVYWADLKSNEAFLPHSASLRANALSVLRALASGCHKEAESLRKGSGNAPPESRQLMQTLGYDA